MWLLSYFHPDKYLLCLHSVPTVRISFSFFFLPHWEACGNLIPWPGIKPMPLAVEAQSLNHWKVSRTSLSPGRSSGKTHGMSGWVQPARPPGHPADVPTHSPETLHPDPPSLIGHTRHHPPLKIILLTFAAIWITKVILDKFKLKKKKEVIPGWFFPFHFPIWNYNRTLNVAF